MIVVSSSRKPSDKDGKPVLAWYRLRSSRLTAYGLTSPKLCQECDRLDNVETFLWLYNRRLAPYRTPKNHMLLLGCQPRSQSLSAYQLHKYCVSYTSNCRPLTFSVMDVHKQALTAFSCVPYRTRRQSTILVIGLRTYSRSEVYSWLTASYSDMIRQYSS